MQENLIVEQDSERNWDLSYALLKVLAMEVNEALKASGVDDVELRQKICSRFGSGMGNFLDQYYMELEGKKYYPLVCFSETLLNTDTALQEIAPLLIPTRDFEYHGAADDATIDFFRTHAEDLDSGPLRVGYVGDELE